MKKAMRSLLHEISSTVCCTHGLQLLFHIDPSVRNLDVLIRERGFLNYVGGGLIGCGVEVGVSSLLEKLEPLEDGILIISLRGMDLCPSFVFLFLGKEEGMIG